MSDNALKAVDLSKSYRITGAGTQARYNYRTLREDLLALPRRLFGRRDEDHGSRQSIWALRSISFEVREGEVIGIIGRNGAGKSTLLKILSRITEPTEGFVDVSGRVGSLLEVGTGFHPELTGRENIYLNGAILGMTKAEITSKFDEIVAFAEIEQFLETPVKHYSTGMYVRLAFAVAAHLEPEILLVDEVLAVGDAGFQKKCLNKMKDVGKGGRTVLFVSHNMPAVRTLCSRAILIDKGGIVYEGETAKAVQVYLEEREASSSYSVWTDGNRPGNRFFRVNSVKLVDVDGHPVSAFNISEGARIEIEYEIIQSEGRAQFALTLFDQEGGCVFSSLSNTESNFYGKPMPRGTYISSCHLGGDLLNAGRFYVSLSCGSALWGDIFPIEQAVSFTAVDDGVLKGDYGGPYGGAIRPRLKWDTLPL